MSTSKRTYKEICDEYMAIFAQLPLEVQRQHLQAIAAFVQSYPLPKSPEDKRIDDIASDLLSDINI